MERVRVGVIGAGFFGEKHATVYSQLPHAELVAISDINAARAAEVAGKLGCDHYTDHKALLSRDDIDAVNIVVPDDLHRPIVLDAVRTGKHILLEKPIAVTVEDCDAILAASEQTDKKFMVAHLVRFDARYIEAKNMIAQGEIGEIVHVTTRRNSPILGARHYSGHCELTTHSGVHDLDFVRWLVDSEYESVYAKGRHVRLKEENIQMYDSVLALYTFENGVIYQKENSWVLPENFPSTLDAKLQVVGTKGVIQIDVCNAGLSVYTNERVTYPELLHWPQINGRAVGAIRDEIIHFLDCIIRDTPIPIRVEEGYRAAIAAINTLKSIKENRVIYF